MIMADSVSSEETLSALVQEMNMDTPNSKMSSKSRIKGRVRRTVLFQPEHPLQLAVQSLLPPKKWSDVEVGVLSTFISRERGGKVRVACKDMEFWDRAAAFVQQ